MTEIEIQPKKLKYFTISFLLAFGGSLTVLLVFHLIGHIETINELFYLPIFVGLITAISNIQPRGKLLIKISSDSIRLPPSSGFKPIWINKSEIMSVNTSNIFKRITLKDRQGKKGVIDEWIYGKEDLIIIKKFLSI